MMLELTSSLIKIMEICMDIFNGDNAHEEITEDNAIVYNGHEFYVSPISFNSVVVDGREVELSKHCNYVVNGEQMSSIKYISMLLA